MPDWFKKHPVLYSAVAVLGFLFWTLPEWLGNVWPLFFGSKTIPQWLDEQRWPGMTLSLQLSASFWIGLGLLGVLAYIAVVSSRKQPYPIVHIFEHKKSSRELVDKVRRMYGDAEYTITNATTDLPQHACGVWLQGGTNSDREHARWGLAKLGIEAKTDYSAKRPHLQVIVGEVALPSKPVTSAAPVPQPNPQGLERKAKELERAARDMQNPLPVGAAIRRQFEDEAEDLRDAAQNLRRTSVEPGQDHRQMRESDRQFESSFLKAARQSECIEIDWRKTDTNLMVSAINKSGDVIEGFELWVEEPLRFADGKFVKQKEFQDYRPTRLIGGNSLLYHGQPESYPFLSYATDRLFFSGSSVENPSQQGNFRTVGIWKVPFRTEIDGVSRSYDLFFDWKNTRRTIPDPCDAPAESGANGSTV